MTPHRSGPDPIPRGLGLRDSGAIAPPRPEESRAIRCLIVDDHPAIRVGLGELLRGEPDIEVAGACESAEDALRFARRQTDSPVTTVDVAIVDFHLGGHSGLWLSRRLRRLPDPPAVIVYSASRDHMLAAAAVIAEASAVVSKSALGDELTAEIRAAARGEHRPPRVPPILAESIGRRLDSVEQAIFGLMMSSVSPTEVAATLRLDDHELDARLWSMLRKLERPGARGRATP